MKLQENEKNKKLFDLLDNVQFTQVIIFVSNSLRANVLTGLLNENNFPAVSIHGQLRQEERLARYQKCKECKNVIMVATDIFSRGVDIDKIDFVVNYDLPEDTDTYLHRVRRTQLEPVGGKSGTIWDARTGGVVRGEEGGRRADGQDPGALRGQGARAARQDRPCHLQYSSGPVIPDIEAAT